MNNDFIRKQIELLAGEGRTCQAGEVDRIVAACWPGGPADRAEPAALRWLRYWRPATSGALLPVCSCAVGRCAVCN